MLRSRRNRSRTLTAPPVPTPPSPTPFRCRFCDAPLGDVVADLGSVTLKSSPANQPWTATIHNTGGDVAVTGTIIDRNGATEGTFDLRPAATAAGAVRNALSLLGAPDASGVVHVAWRSRR